VRPKTTLRTPQVARLCRALCATAAAGVVGSAANAMEIPHFGRFIEGWCRKTLSGMAARAPPASQYAGRKRRRRRCAVDTAVFWGSSAVLGRSQEELRGDRIDRIPL
jgi:hypothetical protein